jgi:hypothetical protein
MSSQSVVYTESPLIFKTIERNGYEYGVEFFNGKYFLVSLIGSDLPARQVARTRAAVEAAISAFEDEMNNDPTPAAAVLMLPAEIESRDGMMPRATVDYWSRQTSLTVIKGETVIRPLRVARWLKVYPSQRYGNPRHYRGKGVIVLPAQLITPEPEPSFPVAFPVRLIEQTSVAAQDSNMKENTIKLPTHAAGEYYPYELSLMTMIERFTAKHGTKPTLIMSSTEDDDYGFPKYRGIPVEISSTVPEGMVHLSYTPAVAA